MKSKHISRRLRQATAVMMLGTALQFGGCDLGQFTTTSVVTLDGRQLATFLVQSAILLPIQNALQGAVNTFFDGLEQNNQ